MTLEENCNEKGNNWLFCFSGVVDVIVLLFTAGGVIQTFFSFIGFTTKQIGLYSAMINAVQIAVMVFGILFVDRIKNIKSMVALFSFSPMLLCGVLLWTCFCRGFDLNTAFYLILAVGTVNNLFVGMRGMMYYRLPYQVIDMCDYEKLENIKAIIGGIASIGITLIISAVAKQIPYSVPMGVGLLVSVVLCVCNGLAVFRMKNVNSVRLSEKFRWSMLIKREFLYFYFPNFSRGVAGGLFCMMTVVCYKEITDSPSAMSLVTTVSAFSAVVGSMIYRAIGSKIKTKTVYLLASVLMTAALPITILGKNIVGFLIFFALAGIGYNIIAVSAAVYAIEIVDYSEIGAFSAERLIMLAAGQALGSYLAGLLLGKVPAMTILIGFGIFQLISGVMSYLYKK